MIPVDHPESALTCMHVRGLTLEVLAHLSILVGDRTELWTSTTLTQHQGEMFDMPLRHLAEAYRELPEGVRAWVRSAAFGCAPREWCVPGMRELSPQAFANFAAVLPCGSDTHTRAFAFLAGWSVGMPATLLMELHPAVGMRDLQRGVRALWEDPVFLGWAYRLGNLDAIVSPLAPKVPLMDRLKAAARLAQGEPVLLDPTLRAMRREGAKRLWRLPLLPAELRLLRDTVRVAGGDDA